MAKQCPTCGQKHTRKEPQCFTCECDAKSYQSAKKRFDENPTCPKTKWRMRNAERRISD